MTRETTRRRVLGVAGGVVGAGAIAPLGRVVRGGARDDGPAVETNRSTETTGGAPSRETGTILGGTDHETTVYVTRGAADGPTVMVVGGIHGDETTGYRSANDVTGWSIDAGTLVVLPEANAIAVERESRHGENGDLNRQFPAGEEPTSELARAIWDAVRRYEPDAFLDLHQAIGIYSGDPTGVENDVGQAIFYAGDGAADRAQSVAAHVNETAVPDSRPRYEFETTHFDLGMEPSGLLATKVALDLDARSFLVEVTSEDLKLETRVRWMNRIVRRFLVEEALLAERTATGSTETDAPDGNEPPEVSIAATPEDAVDVDLERGDTVALDGSGSSDPDGEIATYEWDVDDDGTFERTGASVDVALSSCGTFPVTLRVTDDGGATAAETITLRTTETGE